MINELVEYKGIKVIWNITNSCPYKCKICATSANIDGFDKEVDKIKILNSILTIKDNIRNIDFAGGDPIFLEKDRNIIKKSVQIFNKDKISISTTGYSLSKMKNHEIVDLSQSYDLTYDFPNEYKDLDYREESYNILNYEQALRIKKLGLKINIQIPISKENTKENLINKLCDDLLILNPNMITLIRLMPVGYLKYENYPKDYEPFKFIDKFNEIMYKNNYKNQIKCNCALRCVNNDIDNKMSCSMLNEKIGVDRFGNAFMCIWAGDIDMPVDKNPFFIGNLLKDDLLKLLNSDKVKEIKYKLNEQIDFCKVFSYINSNYEEEFIYKNNDILKKSL